MKDRQQLLFQFICSITIHGVQVIPSLWNVSQNDQTVHSCAFLLSCYLWLSTSKNKMHPQNKMQGSDPFYFFMFYFRSGFCPLILFWHTNWRHTKFFLRFGCRDRSEDGLQFLAFLVLQMTFYFLVAKGRKQPLFFFRG